MKNMRKSAALLSAAVLVSAMPSVHASEALQLSDPTYSVSNGDTEMTVPAPQPGFLTTTVNVTNPGEADASACLVVSAEDNATGKLTAIDADSKIVPANEDAQLSKGITLGSNQTHKYYVWDNIFNHTPLRNTPPTDIKNVTSAVKTNSVDLSWDDSLDDKGVKSYILKLNGIEVARSDSASYQLLGLDRSSSYSCEITACDEEGRLSGSAFVDASTYDMEYCILSENDNENFKFLENHNPTHNQMDNFTEPDFVAGRDCFKNTSQDKTDGSGKKVCFFYFPVSAKYIGADVRNVAIEVTYYDDSGTASPSIQYNSEDGQPGKSVNLEEKTNTKAWKTVYTEIKDAKFINPDSLTNSAFRVSAPSGTRVYKVALCPGDIYSPEAPNVKFGENTTDIYDMLFYPENSESAYGMTYSSINGVGCMYAPNGGTFEFDIRDKLATRTGGYIEVTYFDDGDDTLVLNYNNLADLKGAVDFTDTREFKTVQIPLDAAAFSNGIGGAAGKKFDFTISTKNKSPLAITSVRYVPGDSDYVYEPPTEAFAEVNADGTGLDGTLELVAWPNEDLSKNYDRNISFSGTDGKPAQDGKHYMYNREFTGYASGQAWKRWKNAFYFKINDGFLYGTDYNNVKIEVEYYATSGSIEVLGKNAAGSDTSIGKTAVVPNQWTTKVFEASASDGKNVAFSNGFDSSCDFRINFDCQGYIHKVTVYKDVE